MGNPASSSSASPFGPSPDRPLRIALHLHARESYAVGIVSGIQAVRARTPGLALMTVEGSPLLTRAELEKHPPDALIAAVPADEDIGWLDALACPVVLIGWREREHAHPVVAPDDAAAGALAARALWDRGFRRFGFVSFPWRYGRARGEGFVQAVRVAGGAVEVLELDFQRTPEAELEARLSDWVRRLPVPTGLAAADDCAGRRLLEACRREGREAPRDVAVIGVGDHPLECALSMPALSSVALDLPELGRRATEGLLALLRGEPWREVELVPPLHVVARASTDVTVYSDTRVNRILAYIRRHALEGLRVEDVLREFPMARKTLFNLMRQSCGRTAHEEIRRIQILEARRLLAVKAATVARVAEAVGFSDERQLRRALRTAAAEEGWVTGRGPE